MTSRLPPVVAEGDDVLIRILLVICRLRADDDVPFRSVASRLIKRLSEDCGITWFTLTSTESTGSIGLTACVQNLVPFPKRSYDFCRA